MPLFKHVCLLALLLVLLPVRGQCAQGADLTGMWQDDVGGRYRIRQAGATVVWFDDRSPTVLNVFVGTIQGDVINGQWWDLPGGQALSSGNLSLRIDSLDRLVKTGSSITYGGSVITRVGANPLPDPATCRWAYVRIGDCTGNDVAVVQGAATPEPAQCTPPRAGKMIAISWDGVKQKNWGSSTPVTAYKGISAAACVEGQSPGFVYSCTCGGTVQLPPRGPAGGGGLCADPRTIGFMDEWLSRAVPTGEGTYRFDSWARTIGRNSSSTVEAVKGTPVDPYTWATRCDFLLSVADALDSTNLGNMGAYVRGRLAGR